MGIGRLSDDWARMDSRLTNRELVGDASEQYEIGFGLLFLSGPAFFPTSSRPSIHTAIYDSWLETQKPWLRIYTAAGANTALPVSEPVDTRASFRRMFFLSLLFAAIIGPLNIALLRRKKQMTRLYWTTPAISLTACLLFVLYFAVFEGPRKYMRVSSLTLIDQESRSAATLGWIGFYSPFAEPEGLLFDEVTELTLQQEGMDTFRPRAIGAAAGMDRAGSVDWTEGQRWSGGWIQPRIPLHFKLRKSESRPERIDIKKEGGALKVINRLGARVKAFWYADAEGGVYQAADIPKGAEAALTKTTGVQIGLKKLRGVYASQDWVAENGECESEARGVSSTWMVLCGAGRERFCGEGDERRGDAAVQIACHREVLTPARQRYNRSSAKTERRCGMSEMEPEREIWAAQSVWMGWASLAAALAAALTAPLVCVVGAFHSRRRSHSRRGRRRVPRRLETLRLPILHNRLDAAQGAVLLPQA